MIINSWDNLLVKWYETQNKKNIQYDKKIQQCQKTP